MTDENSLIERIAIEDAFSRYAQGGDEYDAEGWVNSGLHVLGRLGGVENCASLVKISGLDLSDS